MEVRIGAIAYERKMSVSKGGWVGGWVVGWLLGRDIRHNSWLSGSNPGARRFNEASPSA